MQDKTKKLVGVGPKCLYIVQDHWVLGKLYAIDIRAHNL